MSYHSWLHSVTHCADTLNGKGDRPDLIGWGYGGKGAGPGMGRRGSTSLLSKE